MNSPKKFRKETFTDHDAFKNYSYRPSLNNKTQNLLKTKTDLRIMGKERHDQKWKEAVAEQADRQIK